MGLDLGETALTGVVVRLVWNVENALDALLQQLLLYRMCLVYAKVIKEYCDPIELVSAAET